MMGKIFRRSGWKTVLSQADILSSGRAHSTLSGHHIKRTRYVHQVSLVLQSLLKINAYTEYTSPINDHKTFDVWNKKQSDEIHMFKYWSLVIDVDLLMCLFVRSLREGDFHLYVQVCDELCPWFYALDHSNNANWLPIHARDMVEPNVKHPAVYDEYVKRNFTLQKS